MKKKILLFSYYLQKLAYLEQGLLGVSDLRTGLLAVVLSKANIFRRFSTGCTTQPIWFCQPMFVQDLFIYLCLTAEKKGSNICSEFEFKKVPGKWGEMTVEDKELTEFLEQVYPQVKNKEEIDIPLYTNLLGEISLKELLEKFVNITNFRNVDERVLGQMASCAETAVIDDMLTDLNNREILHDMLKLTSKCDIYGKSPAYRVNMEKSERFSL